MPKIILFRVAQDLGASLVSELSRAGYEVATPERADDPVFNVAVVVVS